MRSGHCWFIIPPNHTEFDYFWCWVLYPAPLSSSSDCLWSSYWWGAPHCVLIMLRAKLKEALLRAFNQKRFHFGGFRRTMPKGQRSCMLVIPWILWKRIFGLSSLDRRGFKALTPFAARNPASPTTSRVFWIPFTRCPIPSFHCLPSGSL